MMKTSPLLAAIAMSGALFVAPARAAGTDAGKSASATAFKDTRWEELVPKDWDPLKRFRDANVGLLNDANPKVIQLMRDMRETWDNAPTNSEMDGAAVRLPGYIVPLEEVKGELREFLLVPYFGACIHTPPPPANQIVHVIATRPVKGLRSMDAVWVSGNLEAFRSDSSMGVSGYRMHAAAIAPYKPTSQP
jgi:hypothetical protein